MDSGETPITDNAIESIRSFEYETPYDDGTKASNELLGAMMMYGKGFGSASFPELKVDDWTNSGKEPTPMSINKAKRLLSRAYARIPCEVDGTGVHGYAWMIDDNTKWLARSGVNTVIVPPTKPKRTYDVAGLMAAEEFKLYHHLMQAGKDKLIEWFGPAVFVDLHTDGELPIETTPRDMVTHMTKTYALGRDYRQHLRKVEERFNTPYDAKRIVEEYFLQLQEARDDAELLEQPYTEAQMMNKAIGQFELHHKDTYKAEKVWNAKPAEDRTWSNFKTFWKGEIHQWNSRTKTKEAHEATLDEITAELTSVKTTVSALQAENHSYHTENYSLRMRQAEIEHAFQAQQDDISAITASVRSSRLSTDGAGSNFADSNTSGNSSGQSNSRPGRAPDYFRNLNDGKGLQFSKYCVKCGCNCTHTSRRCRDLTRAEQLKYEKAHCKDTMGGSTKFLAREGKWQSEFGFDSL